MLRRELENWSARTGLNREDAAAAIGVSSRSIRLWLEGKATPRNRAIKALSDLLGVDPVFLLDEFRKGSSGVHRKAHPLTFMRNLKKALVMSALSDRECCEVMYLVTKITPGGSIPAIDIVGAMTGIFLPMYRDDVFEMGPPPVMSVSFHEDAMIRWLRDRPATEMDGAP